LRGLGSEIEFAQTGEELARQRYKPGFTLDLNYGARGGNNLDGSSRPDFLSVMVTMDVPLFTANRQDRLVAARVAETESASYARDNTWRQMNSEIDYHTVSLERLSERIELYQEALLPQAEFYAEAALEAYQDATGDLTSLILAQVAEYELRMDYARLQAERLKTLASLSYLSGEAS
jgi:outer membrane protein TolC